MQRATQISLVSRVDARAQLLESNSAFYAKINQGLITPPIKMGLRKSCWPQHELDAIKLARMAGKSQEEIKSLIANLIAARKGAA